MTDNEDIWDSLFHFCSLRAYMEIVAQTRQFPPEPEATRIRAYQLYEEALAEKHRRKQPLDISHTPRREAATGCEAPEGNGPPCACMAGKSDLRQKTTAKNCLDAARKAAK